MKYALSEVRKTLIALVPFVVAAVKVLSDAIGDGTVNNQEWLMVLLAALTAGGVFAVSNVPPKGRPSRPDVSEAERGDAAITVYPSVPAHRDRPDNPHNG